MQLADRLRLLIPINTRRRIDATRLRLRRPLSQARMLPDFLIIGAQRCGTSSLYRYLTWHPLILKPLRKEPQYFSRRYSLGLRWYRSHFALELRASALGAIRGQPFQTFEATPDYLFHPEAPSRAYQLIPQANLIALLRNPVDRAFSHYQHMVRLGFEKLSFEDAIAAEADRISADVEALVQDPFHYSRELLLYSYVSRGIYADQVQRWKDCFAEDKLMILDSRDFYSFTEKIYLETLKFLGLPPWKPRGFPNASYPGGQAGEPSRMAVTTRETLLETFSPHNERLYALLGRRFDWES